MTPGRRRDITTCLSGNGIKLSSMLPAPGDGPGFNVASVDPLERAAAVDQYKLVADLRDKPSTGVGLVRLALDDIASSNDLTVCIEPTSAN